MGKRGNLLTAAASFGLFALGATIGHNRTKRRLRREQLANLAIPTPRTPPSSSGQCATGASLDCPVCLSELVLPRVAPCGHTLCSTCLSALFAHERRPACPVCRKRIRVAVEKLPVNFLVKAVVEARVVARGDGAWQQYRTNEEEAKRVVMPLNETDRTRDVVAQLRPAWNWFKWTVIIVTEFGAFLVSLKEVLESAPARRRYQRIV